MSKQATAWCAVLGGLAFFFAFALFVNERDDAGRLNEPNYGVPLFLVGAGAFLVLIAVISANGRRPEG